MDHELLAHFHEVHHSPSAFYAADKRRWYSFEQDLGLRWRGSAGETYRAAWVAATGELYVFEHLRTDGGGGMLFVHDGVFSKGAVEELFDGWREAVGEPGSLSWLVTRAARARARARTPSATTAS